MPGDIARLLDAVRRHYDDGCETSVEASAVYLVTSVAEPLARHREDAPSRDHRP